MTHFGLGTTFPVDCTLRSIIIWNNYPKEAPPICTLVCSLMDQLAYPATLRITRIYALS